MEKFELYGLTWHSNFKLLPSSFFAITLFGHVFSNYDTEKLKFILTNSTFGRDAANHESIHVMQANSFKTKYFAFYILYLYFWLKNIFIFGTKNNKAYYNIPFEKEAYANEKNYNYNEEVNFVSQWKKYK